VKFEDSPSNCSVVSPTEETPFNTAPYKLTECLNNEKDVMLQLTKETFTLSGPSTILDWTILKPMIAQLKP